MGIGQACKEESSPAPVKRVTASKDHPGPNSLVEATRNVIWPPIIESAKRKRFRIILAAKLAKNIASS
jgi:hypothetical protein